MLKKMTLARLRNPNVMRIVDIMPEEEDTEEPVLDAVTNAANREHVIVNWCLGPERTSVDPQANGEYWAMMADVWKVSEPEARRMLCANCEYFNNTPEKLAEMEAVPLDKFDMDGGGRGYCTKFDFICHNLRSCQAWEEKPFGDDEEGEDD